MSGWTPELPASETAQWLLPLLMLAISAAGFGAGWLRTRRGWRSGDTRKIFHAAIITLATILALEWGAAALNALGGLMALYLATVLRIGPGHILYEGIARESDAPHRTLWIVVPFLATAAGGITTALLFGPWAPVGYAVSACGDAVGEPVGIRWGRHRYRVWSWGRPASTRSLEGSAAVFLASLLASLTVLSAGGLARGVAPLALLGASAAIGAVSALVEAISPRGLDNFGLQIAAAGLASVLLGGEAAGPPA
jgi:phytol kinase